MSARSYVVFTCLCVGLVLPALLGLLGCGARDGEPPVAARSKVERGAYLVNAGVCADCHTPWVMGPDGPGPDRTRWLQGHPAEVKVDAPGALPAGWGLMAYGTNTAWAGPWGVSFTANLTPDEETGTGTWTAEQFKRILRSGRHLGQGRPILPPMPWFAYKELTDDDLEAIFSYLQSLPPIKNRVPEPLPPATAPTKE